MLNIIWDTSGYFFWLLVVSLFCWILERAVPWRRQQKAFRRQIWQDFFWLAFNGHYAGVLIAFIAARLIDQLLEAAGHPPLPSPETAALLSALPLWGQFVLFVVLKDLLEWCIHNLLHRVPWLWEFHKLHHSILELDWIGNMRFHWMEIVVYQSLTYLPLIILGVNGQVILWVAIVGTLIGHLNHSNLNFEWGPLARLINSPRFHVWHHDLVLHGNKGQNFAIIFSLWDWLFGTAYRPVEDQPDRLGFVGMERYPDSLPARLIYPLWKRGGKSEE
jgi:sterol desaturase/sphingolipid hydroxylase (fatty acid hydroxylase superfamily)